MGNIIFTLLTGICIIIIVLFIAENLDIEKEDSRFICFLKGGLARDTYYKNGECHFSLSVISGGDHIGIITKPKQTHLKFNTSSNINIFHDGIKIDEDVFEISESEMDYFPLSVENMNEEKLICVEFDNRIILDVEVNDLYQELIPREYIFQDKYSRVNCYSLEKVERFNLKIEAEYEFKEGINETTIYIKLFQ